MVGRGGERTSVKKLAVKGKQPSTPTGKTTIPVRVQHTKKRLYVLDTNVPMHDPTCIYRFQEHDIYFPMMVIEELDNNKKGHEEKNRNSRQFSKAIELLTSKVVNITQGIPLTIPSGKIATGSLFLQTEEVPGITGLEKADNQILAVVKYLVTKNKHKVVLVSRDNNMRIKARMAGITAEDYHNDTVIEDTDLLYPGVSVLPKDFWSKHKTLQTYKEGHVDHYRMSGPFIKNLHPNGFVYSDVDETFRARVMEKDRNVATFQIIRDYTSHRHAVSGIVARNLEQNFALNLLLDPEIDFVTLLGVAGTGKTFITLAAAIQQAIDEDLYNEIIITRVTVSTGEDIGFLPGTEEDKMTPWMGALYDNLEVLMGVSVPASKKLEKGGNLQEIQGRENLMRVARNEMIKSRIKIKSLNFMRGRTFVRKFLIIDEFQNLTPKQAKTLITRAGPGTKIVCLGNIAQIDTPDLTEGSSGLTYVVDRFKGWPHNGHVTLVDCERSRLADHANEVL